MVVAAGVRGSGCDGLLSQLLLCAACGLGIMISSGVLLAGLVLTELHELLTHVFLPRCLLSTAARRRTRRLLCNSCYCAMSPRITGLKQQLAASTNNCMLITPAAVHHSFKKAEWCDRSAKQRPISSQQHESGCHLREVEQTHAGLQARRMTV